MWRQARTCPKDPESPFLRLCQHASLWLGQLDSLHMNGQDPYTSKSPNHINQFPESQASFIFTFVEIFVPHVLRMFGRWAWCGGWCMTLVSVLRRQSQSGLWSEFQVSWYYKETHLKTKQPIKRTKKNKWKLGQTKTRLTENIHSFLGTLFTWISSLAKH